MQREFSNLCVTTETIAKTNLVASRRGCTADITAPRGEESRAKRLVHGLQGDPNYEEHMGMIRGKLQEIEIHCQLMETSLLAQNRSQFAKSAEQLCRLAESAPSQKLFRSAIRASLLAASAPEKGLAALVEEISQDIVSLKKELGSL